ncbi:MAG: GNAT family N-acetyltransferase [Bacteroidota bacterium]
MNTIRPAKFKEIKDIIEFQILMARETENLELDREQLSHGVEAVFEDRAKGTYYVAVNEAEEVVACLLTTYEWSEWRNGQVIWIQSVFVKAEYRGQGIFKKLFAYIKDIVDQDKTLKGIRLYAEKENIRAHQVYKSLGMNNDHYLMFELMKEF